MKDEENMENSSHKKSYRISQIIFYIIAMVILLYVMIFFRINPLIIVVIIAFISLLMIGSILKRRKQKSLYSELYPKKNQEMSQRPQRKFELNIKEEEEPTEKKFREISLDFKYSKALINKCENCGMIITGYNTNCPICGKAIEMKGVITKCKKCGMTIPRSAKKCPICGTRIT